MSYSENPFLPQMLSPAAYEMGRYGRTPASHFYGLPNISVPLAEVRAKGYNLPIFLSYNAGGNRPEQHPGWAGLGWSLHAGGSIVRVINGMKDEMSRLEYESLLEPGGISPSSDPGYLYHIGEVQSETDWDNGATLAQKSIPWREYEPDEYIINVDGIHASFFITGDNEISIVSKDESSFELESYDIGSDDYYTALDMYSGRTSRAVKARRYKYLKRFVIRDKNGNRFRFSGKELSPETGLYDFSARFLHPRFGRFTTMDPLAEKYPGISPYSYCKGNPVRYIDLTGKSYGDYYSQDGRFITSDGIDDDKIYLVHQSNVELYDQIMIKTNDRSMAIRALRKNSEEIGGLIIQNRKEDSSEYTMSKFTALGKDMTISGYIIEPAGPSTPTANQNRRVPEGLYYLDNYSSSNYPSHFVLYNGLVPKSRAILYHVGNTFEDTRGCMLPGSTYDGSGYVGNSRDKVIELFDFIKTIGPDNIRVIINNYIDR